MSDGPVRITRDGAVAVLTIDRPEKLNALDAETLAALEAAVNKADRDPNVHVIVFTGTGRAFVAGGDIADLESRRGLAHYLEFGETIHRVFRRIETCDTPTIAAVNGWALGGGAELMLAIDIRLVAASAKVGVPEITLGLFPGAGGSQRLSRQVPQCHAREMMFAGEAISAEDAVAIGLASRVVADDALMDEAMALAGKIAARSPLVLKLLKRALIAGGDMPLTSALAHEQAMISLVLDTDDAHEGCQAFLEKRKPDFKGS